MAVSENERVKSNVVYEYWWVPSERKVSFYAFVMKDPTLGLIFSKQRVRQNASIYNYMPVLYKFDMTCWDACIYQKRGCIGEGIGSLATENFL